MSNVETAAQNAVDAMQLILTLRSDIEDLTPPSTPAEEIELDDKNDELRYELLNLKNANAVLFSSGAERLIESQVKLDGDGNIIAPWSFSDSIENTTQKEIADNDVGEVPVQDLQESVESYNISIKSKHNEMMFINRRILSRSSDGDSITELSKTAATLRVEINKLVVSRDSVQETINKSLPQEEIERQSQEIRKLLEDHVRSTVYDRTVNLKELEAAKKLSYETQSEQDKEAADIALYEYNASVDREHVAKEALSEFLDTPLGKGTTTTSPTTSINNENLTDSEIVAAKRLKNSIVDEINTATNQAGRDAGYLKLQQFNAANASGIVEREVLPAPDLSSMESLNDTIQDLISERNTLIVQLSETEQGTPEFEALLDLLEENNNERTEVSRTIIGLQDNVNFGVKVNVETDELGNYIIKSYETTNGSYQNYESSSRDILYKSRQDVEATARALATDEYEKLRFVVATEVYDAEKGVVVPREKAEEGQPNRYVYKRPVIDDIDEFLAGSEEELNNIDLALSYSRESIEYHDGLREVIEPFDEELESLNDELARNTNDIIDVASSVNPSLSHTRYREEFGEPTEQQKKETFIILGTEQLYKLITDNKVDVIYEAMENSTYARR